MELPSEVDLIVLGTGLQEALIAAAAAKAGKSVLHLDVNQYYGSGEATLEVPAFLDLVQKSRQKEPSVPTAPSTPGRNVLAVENQSNPWSQISCNMHDITLQTARGYNIDLWPQIAYCCDPIIEVLLHCQAQHYLEFKLLQASCVWEQGRISPVPASRKEVFEHAMKLGDKRALWRFLKGASEALEGRGSLQEAFGEQPFSQVLQQQGVPGSISAALTYAVAMAELQQPRPAPTTSRPAPQQQGQQPQAASPQHPSGRDQQQHQAAAPQHPSGRDQQPGSTQSHQAVQGSSQDAAHESPASSGRPGEEGSPGSGQAPGVLSAAAALQRMSLYMRSAGRYGGSGAFLVPMYGTSELAQAFCRVAAVHGAVYALRQGVSELLLDPASGRCTGVKLPQGQEIRCGALAGTLSMLPSALYHVPEPAGIARAVLITDTSLHPDHQQFSLTLPPDSHGAALRLLQLSSMSASAPSGRFVVHLTTPSLGRSPTDIFAPVISALSAASSTQPPSSSQPHDSTAVSPHTLLTAFWSLPGRVEPSGHQIPNVAICQPHSTMVGFGTALQGAREQFAALYPGEDLFGLSSADAVLEDDSDEEAVDALEAALAGLPDA